MEVKATTKEAYRLLHEGTLALAEIEATGIRIDTAYCERMQKTLDRQIGRLEDELKKDPDIMEWAELYDKKFNIDSNAQLSWYLFKHKGLPPVKLTDNEKESVDNDVLETINLPFVKTLSQYRRLLKAKDTYLAGILRETVDGYLHPFFNLNTARTFRSSSTNINFQNQPIRMKDISKIIRQAFIPRPGHRFGGVDGGGIEVKIATCYHKDPNMIEYITNPEADMHRDTAMDAYLVSIEEITKEIRWWGKSGFVFPQFYGDWWKTCAESMWAAIDHDDLKTKQGVPLKEHLRSKGIKELGKLDAKGNPSKGSFYERIKDVERIFWDVRFPVYKQWRKDWFAAYEKNGYLDMLTGFRCSGIMGKNDVSNYPVQGAAFHWLLWSLIELHRWMKAEKLESKIIGQIHDEITMDAHPDELDTLLYKAEDIMCREIVQEWPWIIVPITIEAEFAPVDRPWFEKAPVEIVQF